MSLRRVVALEAAAAVVVAGIGLGAWPLCAVGVAGAGAAFLRWRGRWATTHLVSALRRSPRAVAAGLGLAEHLVPGLSVVEHRDRNEIPAGIVHSGHGLATVVDLGPGAVPFVAELGGWLATERTRPAGLQLLTELRFPPPWAAKQGHPVVARRWLVPRHEPLWTPEEVEARGGGVAGARSAALSATLRLADHLARQGISAKPLDAAAVRELFRQLGETGSAKALRGAWVGPDVVHCCLSANLRNKAEWDALIATLRHTGVARVITSQAVHGTVVVRLVGAAECVWRARTALIGGGLARSMFDGQSEGMIATLPLGRPTRRRADVLLSLPLGAVGVQAHADPGAVAGR